MHLCKTCTVPQMVFGILFLIVGFNLWTAAPFWFNGWSIAGAYLFLWGLIDQMKK